MIWLIVIVGIGILIFLVLRAAALNKTPPLERVEPGTNLTPAGAARAEAEKYDKEQEEKYFQSPLTKRIIASISDGTGRLPEQIDVYEDRVTGRTEGAVRAFDFLTERVPKLEKKSFAYRDKDCCGDYNTFYEDSSPAKALAMAINRILGGEYDMKWEFGKDYWGAGGGIYRSWINHVVLTLKTTIDF